MKKQTLFIAIFHLCFIYSYAGFPVGKGRTVFSLSYSYFYSDHYFDNHNNLKKSDNIFSSHFTSFFVAHGFTRRLDIAASLPYLYESSTYNGSYLFRKGFGDAQISASYTKPNKLYDEFTTIKISGLIPLSHGTNPIPISYDAPGIDVLINYAKARKSLLHKGYFSAEVNYRHYFGGDGPNQFLFNVQRFTSISRYCYIDYGIYGIISSSKNVQYLGMFNSSKDFYNMQIKLSLCKKVRRNMSVYVEGFITPVGNNTACGVGGSIFSVLRIP